MILALKPSTRGALQPCPVQMPPAQGGMDGAAKTIAVPGLPPDGYTFEFLPILLGFFGVCASKSRPHVGRNGLRGLRQLTATPGLRPAGATEALTLLAEAVKELWPQTPGPRYPRGVQALDLETQVCAWMSAGCVEENLV